jgi:hypothetical protein
MATVVMHAVVSVDGFIADENDDVGPLFEWYFNGDVPIGGEAVEERHAAFRVSALALGLVDEVAMDVVPVVFGTGKGYFGPVASQHLLEDSSVVIQGDRVLHLRYPVRR